MSRTTSPRRVLLTIAESAEHYNVSTKTIRRRIADGTLVAYRTGPRLIRVDVTASEAKLLRPIGGAA